MPLPTGEVIGILGDNLRLRRSVLPIPKRHVVGWAKGLGLPRGGETVLYTGMMYQLIPYIEALVKAEQRLGNSWLARFASLGRKLNKVVNISAFLARPRSQERRIYEQTLINAALLLQKAGVKFGYAYEADLYSGALAYDLGLDNVVRSHAQRVYQALKRVGAKTVITLDPHTTHMLRSVYPKFIPGYDLEVKNYLEVLDDCAGHSKPTGSTAGFVSSEPAVLHDPCVFARYEGIIEAPRRLLAASGVEVCVPEKSGRMTWCCGGPVESLYPEKAAVNARKRMEQLEALGRRVITMCPLCLVNLSGAASPGVKVDDISTYLREGLVGSGVSNV
ncbi:MAG: (Fe-S)-binding protein [Thermoleophilia bacterium]|nr:(Fe-S)-binding protein [Thermoleophilia bacterium]